MKKLFPVIIILLFFATTVSTQQPVKIPHLELPAIKPNEVIVKHLAYTLSFNIKHEQANWVAYKLTAAETHKTVNRSKFFKPDLAIKTGSATNEDYEGSGYDRGHLAPAADMSWSEKTLEESFFYSNMSPQVPGFNRGIWKKLEELVRQWAIDNQDIYVVTGPVLENNLPTIGTDKVSVPRYYYKVILDYTEPELKGIGFILPNASSTLPLQNFAVTIESVEHLTGINFFPALPYKQELAIEKTICIPCWTWTTTSSKKSHLTKSNNAMVQCSAITKAGTRCKRMTSNASGLCTQHENQ
jgi:endonuclease G